MYGAHCSLVGTVQRIIFIIYIYQEGFVSISHRYGSTLIIKEAYMYAEKKFQSLIGTVQQKKIKKSLRRHARWFQSLIGTVQQENN